MFIKENVDNFDIKNQLVCKVSIVEKKKEAEKSTITVISVCAWHSYRAQSGRTDFRLWVESVFPPKKNSTIWQKYTKNSGFQHPSSQPLEIKV